MKELIDMIRLTGVITPRSINPYFRASMLDLPCPTNPRFQKTLKRAFGNVNTPTFATAERAADLIKDKR